MARRQSNTTFDAYVVTCSIEYYTHFSIRLTVAKQWAMYRVRYHLATHQIYIYISMENVVESSMIYKRAEGYYR